MCAKFLDSHKFAAAYTQSQDVKLLSILQKGMGRHMDSVTTKSQVKENNLSRRNKWRFFKENCYKNRCILTNNDCNINIIILKS